MIRLLGRCGVGVAALALAIGTAGPARGAVLWTLAATPLTVTTGVQTTFSLRATLTLLGEIWCVEVNVPEAFVVSGAAVTGSNAGDGWASEVVENDVFVRVTSGGDRLRSVGHYVDFTITATAWSTGSPAWGSHSHEKADCSGPESLVSVPPVVLVLGPAATPTPAPTVAPTATPLPTLLPSLPPLPSLVPSTPRPTPRPSDAPPEVSERPAASGPAASTEPRASEPGSSVSPSASDRPAPPSGSGEGPPDASAGSPGGSPAGAGALFAEPPAAAAEAAPVPVALGALGLLGSIDIWIVPGLLLGVPGLLVVAFVALQALGALAWIPAVRRLRGSEPEPGPMGAG